MADTYRTRMATARFRGIDFLTDDHEARGGNRLAVHEYPASDEVLVEDLGAKAKEWRVNAYFIGPNYDLERNDFLAKLAEHGADWLTHPWLGYLWVRVASWSLSESVGRGGICTVSVDFVPGGEQPFTAEPDRVDVASSSCAAYADAAQLEYAPEAMSATGLDTFVAAAQGKLEMLRTAIALATLPLTWANQVLNVIAGAKTDIGVLMATPSKYAAMYRSLADTLGLGDGSDIADIDRPRVVRRVIAAANATAAVKLTGVAATDPAVRRNIVREDALRGHLLLASAAQLALADYRAADDRDAVLAAVVEAIDAALVDMSDDVFQAAVAMRTALIDALLAQDLAPAQYRDVVAPQPATVLAYRVGVDEDVLIARNRVRHPLFVRGRIHG